MPLTLRQLEGRRDACIEKIQELKVLADGIGGAELGSLTFNSSGFFTGLVDMSKEEIDAFLIAVSAIAESIGVCAASSK